MGRQNIRSFMEFATQRNGGVLDVDEFVERFPDDPADQQILLAMLSVEIGMSARRNSKHIRRLWIVAILALALGVFSAGVILGVDVGVAVLSAFIGGGVSAILRFL